MKIHFAIWQPWLAICWLAAVASAQEANEANPNRFSLSGRIGFNISAKFKNLGGVSSSAAPGPATGGGAERIYDDGFVRVDSAGNNGGLTWFWGYDNATQVAGDSLLMHSAASAADGVSKSKDDTHSGFEFTYGRRLGQCGRGSWGLEAALGFMDLDIRDDRTLLGNATLVTDAYSLGGIVPPLAPYAGSFAGPGALIGDSPTRTTTVTPGSAVIAGQRNLDASLYTLRLGPYFELPLSQKFSVQLGGGVALGLVDSRFSFTERVTVGGGPTISRAGSHSDDGFLAGGYVDAQIVWAVTDRFSLFTGGQFQYLENFKQQAAGKEAEVQLNESIFFTFGFRVRF